MKEVKLLLLCNDIVVATISCIPIEFNNENVYQTIYHPEDKNGEYLDIKLNDNITNTDFKRIGIELAKDSNIFSSESLTKNWKEVDNVSN